MRLVIIRLFLISLLMNLVSSEMAKVLAFFVGVASSASSSFGFFVSLLTEPCKLLFSVPLSQEIRNG